MGNKKTLRKEEITAIFNDVSENSMFLNGIIQDVVEKVSKPLDEIIEYASELLKTEEETPDNEQLDRIALKLPIAMYYMGVEQETIGIREDVAKELKMDIYNQVILKAEGTVAAKESEALMKSQSQTIVNAIYSRAYKIIKQKMEIASSMLSSVKKVISRRMSEAELSNMAGNRTSTKEWEV